MARVIVVNPPHRKKHRAKRHLRRKIRRVRKNRPAKRRFSAKARAAALRNLKKARRKIHRKIRRKMRRHRRKKRLSKTFKNPFAGTLAVMGNPKRKRRHHIMARRKHRRSHRRTLSNPFSANAFLSVPKEMISTPFLMEAAGVTAGFVLPNIGMNYLPVSWRSTTVTYYASKVGVITVTAVAAAATVGKRVAKWVMVGGAVSLLLDLYTEFMKGVGPVHTAPAPAGAPATQTFYGNLSAYYGGMTNDWDV